MAAWLAARAPEDVDQAAHSQASRHGVELRVRFECRYPEKGPSYQIAVDCRGAGSEEGRLATLADVHRLMTPAPGREIEGWLAELSVIVARRASEPMDEALRLEAYASRLRAYPADVAKAAILGKRWQFWPTWAELAGECDRLSAPRRHMLAELRGPFDPPETERKREPAELERIREVAKRYATEMEMADRAKRPVRIPHWSESAAPVDPRWAELRRARAASPLTAPEPAA
jgi:hypothetical protein